MAHYSSRINMIVLASLALVLGVLGESLNYRAKEDPPELLGNLCPKTELEYSLQTNVCGAPPLAFPDPREDYSPWTARPMCINVDTAKPGASPHIEPFCTYTNANFADGRGISFFTSQSIMDDVVKSPPFTEPESIKGMNDLINPPWGPPPYESRWFPGKGIGLVANRTIVRGERIMQETPSFVFNRAIFSQTDEENRLPMQWNAVYQLPKHTREELLALHKHHGGDEIDDLMRTNAFGAYYGEDDLHNNILPRISRFNHDCRPNAHYYFEIGTMTQYVHAVRNIYPGEEILVNYTDSEYTFDERQAATMVSWGFACQCSICRQPPPHLAASDKRLRMIKALKSLLNDWTEVQPERAQMAELLVTLYKQERLDVPIAQAYEASAYAYSIIGDEYKTMTWASKAVEAMTVLYGDDHPLTKDLEVLMLNPTEHRTWRYQAPKEDTVEESGSGTESAAESSSSKWGFF